MRVTSRICPAERSEEEQARHELQESIREGFRSSSLDPSKQTSNAPSPIVLPGYTEVTGCDLPGRLSCIHLHHRHAGFGNARLQVWNVLRETDRSDSTLARFVQCGMQATAELSPNSKEARITSNNCRSRWCPACARDRAATIAANLAALVTERGARFVTLTRRHSHAPLTDQLDSLLASFRRLRQRGWWTEAVTGGAAFIELHRGDHDGLWHVHLHVLCESEFLPQADLSREWYAVTTDSSIVDVRAIASPAKAASYVAKYVSKPGSARVYNDPTALREMIDALAGRRLCMTFGTWRGTPLEPDEAPEIGWTAICPLGQLWDHVIHGDPEAVQCWTILVQRYPCLQSFAHELANTS